MTNVLEMFLVSLLATGGMAAMAAPVPANVLVPMTNIVVWELQPETLPDWGAPPDDPFSATSDKPPLELELDDKAPDKDVQIVPFKRGQEWHGRSLQKTVAIYEDFTLEWQMRWDQKSVGATCHYWLDFGFGWVGLTDAWAGEAGHIGGQITGDGFKDGEGREPLQGQALFRIERANGVFTVYRDSRILYSKKARGTISAIKLKDEVYKNYARTRFTTGFLRLLLPSADIAPTINSEIKTALQQVRKLYETNNPFVYLDTANFEAQLDLLRYDLQRCPHADIRAQCESNRLSLAGQTEFFFRKAETDLQQLGYQSGMILQGSSGMEADLVIQAAGQWQTTYERQKAELAGALKAIREELKQFARQPDDWQKERQFQMDHRAWITNHFVLKHDNHYGLEPPGYDEALRYMGEMGCGMLEETPMFRNHQNPVTDAYIKYHFDTAAAYGLRSTPCFWYSHRGQIFPSAGIPGYPSSGVDWADARELEEMKAFVKHVIEKCGRYPAFAGIHLDEINYSGGWSEENIKQFRIYLQDKYTPEKLAELGITDVETVLPPKPEDRYKEKVLFMEHQEWVAHAFEGAFKTLSDYAKSLKPDCLILPLLSLGPSFYNAPFTASLARMSQLGDSIQIDPYLNGVIDEAYMCDLVRNSSTKPLWLTVGTHYGGNTETLRRDYAIALVHADGLYVFDWPFIYQTPPLIESWRPGWKAGGWKATWEVFEKANKLEPYLLHTVAGTRTAMLHSERTVTVTSYKHDSFHGLGGGYHREQVGIYSALAQSHLSVAPLYAETLTPARLRDYRVLIVASAQSLADEEIQVIRNWTAAGGFLIVTGGSLLSDRWGRGVSDYHLADIMGVGWVKSADGLTNWTFKARGAFMDGQTVNYRKSMQYDEVTPVTAEVLAEWSNGKPAVTLNKFGQGRCCFVSARLPGCCYQPVMGNRNRFPYVKNYDAGVREFWAELVTWALGVQNESVPVEVKNCPQAVEVTLRIQPATGRQVLHFLNYDEAALIKGIEVTWRLPACSAMRSIVGRPAMQVKVFYAADGEIICAATTNSVLSFVLRDLDAHETVVAEPLTAR